MPVYRNLSPRQAVLVTKYGEFRFAPGEVKTLDVPNLDKMFPGTIVKIADTPTPQPKSTEAEVVNTAVSESATPVEKETDSKSIAEEKVEEKVEEQPKRRRGRPPKRKVILNE